MEEHVEQQSHVQQYRLDNRNPESQFSFIYLKKEIISTLNSQLLEAYFQEKQTPPLRGILEKNIKRL